MPRYTLKQIRLYRALRKRGLTRTKALYRIRGNQGIVAR